MHTRDEQTDAYTEQRKPAHFHTLMYVKLPQMAVCVAGRHALTQHSGWDPCGGPTHLEVDLLASPDGLQGPPREVLGVAQPEADQVQHPQQRTGRRQAPGEGGAGCGNGGRG